MTSGVASTTDLQSHPIYGGGNGWYKLLEHLSSGALPLQEAFSLARQGHEGNADAHWVLPLAMVHWMERRYSDAFAF